MKVTKSESSPSIDLLSTQVGSEMVGFRKCCQADECNSDLSDAKRYYRRHKVCELHAKAAVVLVKTIRQRFCQQCSKFHEISKFDFTKKSCRDRLADHNERRRKTHIESKYKEVKDNERIRGLVVKKHLKHFLNLNEVTAQMSPCSSSSISTTATTTTTTANFYPNGANHVELNLANIASPDYIPFSNAMNIMSANHPRAFF